MLTIMVFYLKEGDTSPAIKFQLQDEDRNPVNIAGFEQLRFHMQKTDSVNPTVLADTSSGVSAVDADKGIVQYEWDEGDTDRAGEYEAEFQVRFSGGDVETFPNRRDIKVEIEEQIE